MRAFQQRKIKTSKTKKEVAEETLEVSSEEGYFGSRSCLVWFIGDR